MQTMPRTLQITPHTLQTTPHTPSPRKIAKHGAFNTFGLRVYYSNMNWYIVYEVRSAI